MRGQEYGVRHLTVESPQSLESFLNELVPIERARFLCELGSIYLNGSRVTDPSTTLRRGDHVRVHLEPRRYPKPADLKNRITFQSDDSLIVDKPAGVPVHALVDNLKENLITFLEDELGTSLYVTHRLDLETSGLLVLAKTVTAQTEINAKFQNRKWKRTYIALTEKPLELGSYVHFMTKSPKAPKTVTLDETPDSLRCELIILRTTEVTKLASTLGREWKLDSPKSPTPLYEHEIQLLTGRTHQIRAQLSALGAPIVGDGAYGSSFKILDSDTNAQAIALWAFRIQNLDE